MTPYVKKLLPFSERLGQTAFAIAGQVELPMTEHKLLEPKWLALALLCRTLGNFRGAVRLLEQGLLVEARVLTRCCFENLFLIGGLYSQGIEFAKQMKADDVAGRKNRLRFIMDHSEIFGGLSEDTKREMERAQKSLQAAAKAQHLKFKKASAIGPFKDSYLAYSQYSGDAAHPTFTALMRHFSFKGLTATFDVVPEPGEDQLNETLHFACVAMIGAAAAVNEMCGLTEAGRSLHALNEELRQLQLEQFGERTLSEGMEIRVENEGPEAETEG